MLDHRGLAINTELAYGISDYTADIVYANPPYLPGEASNVYELSLLAGRRGYEAILEFIDEAYRVLKRGGVLLLIFSSLSGENRVFKHLIMRGFRIIHLLKKHFFFEDIIGVGAVKE